MADLLVRLALASAQRTTRRINEPSHRRTRLPFYLLTLKINILIYRKKARQDCISRLSPGVVGCHSRRHGN
jgi:hypothetical protein